MALDWFGVVLLRDRFGIALRDFFVVIFSGTTQYLRMNDERHFKEKIVFLCSKCLCSILEAEGSRKSTSVF